MTPTEIFSQAQAFHQSGQLEQARLCYEFILKFEPYHAEAWARLGVALRQLDHTQEAITAYRQALALDPTDAETHNNLGVALQFTGAHTEAIASYHQAWQLRSDYHSARLREGMEHLLLGDYNAGLPLYEARIHAIPNHRSLQLGPGHWDGSVSPNGRRVLLYAEQGLGDTLQFARYAPLLADRGATVFLEVQPPLQSLLTEALGPSIQVFASGQCLPSFDLHCPLPSLPRAFQTQLDTIPHTPLRLPNAPPRSPASLDARLRVGFVWAGNPAHSNDTHRSLPLQTFLPLMRLPGITPMVLQKDLRPGDQALLDSLPHLDNPSAQFTDFRATVAALQTLDCIITVDTSVAHLAGCLGLPTCLLLSTIPDWRWLLERQDSPWYPSLRLFRQDPCDDWSSVVGRLGLHLRQLGEQPG